MPSARQIKEHKQQYNVHLSNGLSINDISKEQYDKLVALREKRVNDHVWVENKIEQKDMIITSKFLVSMEEIAAIEQVDVKKPVLMKL